MSTTSKSPRDVLVTAWQIGKLKLPSYTHVNSPKKFTQPQLFACLVLKNFLQTDYRGIVWQLLDSPALAEAIELASVPHFTTLQKAARRLLGSRRAQRLLDATVVEQLGRRKRVAEAAIDSTGMGATCASPYFVQRRAARETPWKTVVYHRYPKLGLVTDVESHLILAFQTGLGPRPDVDEFRSLLGQAAQRVRLDWILADAGYDSEANHHFAREELELRTVIPPHYGRPSSKPARGRYRRLMQTRFNRARYRRRSQAETVMSMIKRRQGNHCRGKTPASRQRELHLFALTHNIMILWRGWVFYRAGQNYFLDSLLAKS
jgi:transposase